jgi:protein-S-isoprenylcysteine O-methyltransferase
MNLPRLVMILSYSFFVSELALSFSRRSKSGAKTADRGSLWFLWVILMGGVAFGIFATNAWPHTRLAPMATWQIAGCILMIAGGALRWWAILYLGKFFTVNVAIHDQHRVVDSGPYRYIRHPSYTGALLSFFGLALGLASWVSIATIVVATLVAYAWRMQVEERALSSALGENYVQYMRRTKRLVPGIY